MKFDKERAKQLIKELDDVDYHDIKTGEILKNRRRIRKELETLYYEEFITKKDGNEEYLKEIRELIEKLEDIRKGMLNKSMKFMKKLSKIHNIIGILAIIIIFGWIGFSLLSEGDYKTTNAFKGSIYEGFTVEDIFNEVDPDVEWFCGETEDGEKFVDVSFNLSMDINNDGINELEDVVMQWTINDNGDKFEFYTLTINGASQNNIVCYALYEEVMDHGVSSLKSKLNKSNSKSNLGSLDNSKNDGSSKYLNYTFNEIKKTFGADYLVSEFEGEYFIMYIDSIKTPYSFGFISLEDNSKVQTISLVNNAEVAGVHIGMTQSEIIDNLGKPDWKRYNEETMAYETYYEFDGYSLTFISESEYSETVEAFIRRSK